MNLNRLRGEIAATYKTQSAFAQALGWHKNKVSKLLQGRYCPDTNEAAAIAEVLSLSEQQYCAIFLNQKSPNGDAKEA